MVRIHRITCLWVTLLYLVSLVLMVSINYSVADFRRNEVSHDQVILVTGFEPFSGNRVNSSWEAVRRLDGLQVLGRRVVTLQLPVVWDQASGQLQDAIDRYQPELVINVGQAGTRFELDSRAQNVAGHNHR